MPKILENIYETILNESKVMLINGDYDSFNIRDLSNKCDISIGTIYNYFPNKYELVTSIVFSDWNKSLERMKDINTNFNTLEDKLFKVYQEITIFLDDYLSIFKQLNSNAEKKKADSCLTFLFPIINEIVTFEREKATITSPLSNKKICHFIINNLIFLTNEKTLTFHELFSLLKL